MIVKKKKNTYKLKDQEQSNTEENLNEKKKDPINCDEYPTVLPSKYPLVYYEVFI